VPVTKTISNQHPRGGGMTTFRKSSCADLASVTLPVL
jgi:hypothetical protein